MAYPTLSLAQAKATIAAIEKCGGNQCHAGIALGISPNTVGRRLQIIKALYPKLKIPPGGKGGPPSTVVSERTLADDITFQRAQQNEKAATAKLKEALAELQKLQDKMKDLEWAARASYTPAEWALPNHPRRKREHMPYLITSDHQVGEIIDADETETGYGYSPQIYSKRYRHLIHTAIYLCTDHSGKDWSFPGIIYVRGGDTIDGNLHPEDAGKGTLTPIESVELAFEEESAGITKLADAFGKVEVKAPGAAGNHDRITHKPRTKNAEAHSYDRLISYMLRRHFHNDKRVTFQVSKSFDIRFPIYEQNILFTHGDRIGSRGGQGFIGPAATILRGAAKVIAEQAALGRRIDRVDMGHHHYPMHLDWVTCNGCLPGYSQFAKSFRMRPTPPQQFLLMHHPRRGVVDIKPITLTEA